MNRYNASCCGAVCDDRVRALANQCLDAFGPVGYGLGSQISQIAAIMLPNRLDHMIKEELGIKGYARYMDDGYLIHHNKAHLEHCLTRIQALCDELHITLNPKKTTIKRLSDGFDFLKVRFRLTNTGKVVRRMSYDSVKTMHRKLKKFRKWHEHGRYVKIRGRKRAQRILARRHLPRLRQLAQSYGTGPQLLAGKTGWMPSFTGSLAFIRVIRKRGAQFSKGKKVSHVQN